MSKKTTCKSCGSDCYSRGETPLCRSCFHLQKKEQSAFGSRYEYAKNWQLLKKYNIDLDGLYLMWVAFEGKCCICRTELTAPDRTRGQKRTSCCIDHNHSNGHLRGLLCNSCNKAIGLFNDNPEIVLSAYKYLGGNNEKISNN